MSPSDLESDSQPVWAWEMPLEQTSDGLGRYRHIRFARE